LNDVTYRSKKDCIKDKQLKGRNETNLLEWLYYNKGQAEIHMMALAEAMYDAYNESIPKELEAGEWHIPFGDKIDQKDIYNRINNPVTGNILDWKPIIGIDDGAEKYYQKAKIKISTAMCARTSYTVVGEEDKKSDLMKDIELHDKLLESKHMSPFEHCAQAMDKGDMGLLEDSLNTGWSGNFRGFIQYRKTIPNENISK
jgi:hypothetical protein